MSHEPHELPEEFPQDAAIIHRLKETDPHFAQLSNEYHAINHTIYRIETGIEPTSDETLEDFKKRRLKYLDEIAEIISKARHS